MTFPTVVGVTGYAQHGKDTLAARLVERHGYTRFAFADGVRAAALGIDPYVWVANRGTLFSPGWYRLSHLVEGQGWDEAKRVPEVRRLLQTIGTEGVRDVVGEDSWVRACERAIAASMVERAVITDVRFPNEAAWVHSVGGSMVRVVRPDFDNGVGTDHPSEAHIERLPVDITVSNDGDVTDLCVRADAVAADVEEGFGRRYIGEWCGVPVVTDPQLGRDDIRPVPVLSDDVDDVTTSYEALVHRYQGEGR